MVDYADGTAQSYVERSHGAHAAYTLHYHVVWSVRRRRPALTADRAAFLRDLLLHVGAQHGIHLLAFHIESTHVHALISLKPDQPISTVMQTLKGTSSHILRETFPELRTECSDGLWGTGYFARTLGDVNVSQAKAYLDRQKEHHAGPDTDP